MAEFGDDWWQRQLGAKREPWSGAAADGDAGKGSKQACWGQSHALPSCGHSESKQAVGPGSHREGRMSSWPGAQKEGSGSRQI